MNLLEFPQPREAPLREVARPHRRIVFDAEAERLRAEIKRTRQRARAELRYIELRTPWTVAYEAYQVALRRWREAGSRFPNRNFQSGMWNPLLLVIFVAEAYLFSAAFSAAGETDRAAWVMGTAVAAGFTAGPYALARLFRHPTSHGLLAWFVAVIFIAAGGWLVAELGPLRVEVITRTLASVGAAGAVLGVGAVWALTLFAGVFSLVMGFFRLDPDFQVELSHEELRAREKGLLKEWRRFRPVAERLLALTRRAALADRLIQVEALCAIDDFGLAYLRNGGQLLADGDLGRHWFDPDLINPGNAIAADVQSVTATMARVESEVAERLAQVSKQEESGRV